MTTNVVRNHAGKYLFINGTLSNKIRTSRMRNQINRASIKGIISERPKYRISNAMSAIKRIEAVLLIDDIMVAVSSKNNFKFHTLDIFLPGFGFEKFLRFIRNS
jgi:hypothetical protein